jgi:trk system potassium uptake protein TrkA
MLPTRETVLQEGDMLHIVIREENAAHAYAVLESGPEDD